VPAKGLQKGGFTDLPGKETWGKKRVDSLSGLKRKNEPTNAGKEKCWNEGKGGEKRGGGKPSIIREKVFEKG